MVLRDIMCARPALPPFSCVLGNSRRCARQVQRLRRRLQHDLLRLQQGDEELLGRRHPRPDQRAPHDGQRRRRRLPVDALLPGVVRRRDAARPGHLDLQPRPPVGHDERRDAHAVPGRRRGLEGGGRQGPRGHPLRCATLLGAPPSRQAHACVSPRVRCACTGEDLRATSNQGTPSAVKRGRLTWQLRPSPTHTDSQPHPACVRLHRGVDGQQLDLLPRPAPRLLAVERDVPGIGARARPLRSRRAPGGAHATLLQILQFAFLAYTSPCLDRMPAGAAASRCRASRRATR